MAVYSQDIFYLRLQQFLMDWVWDNHKLRNKISRHDLQYLFEFDQKRGLSIDLRRFDAEYYREVFYPPELKKPVIDEFVRKLCRVISQVVVKTGREELTLTITVRHMISEISHWKTFYIDGKYAAKPSAPLIKKETDWFYSFDARK